MRKFILSTLLAGLFLIPATNLSAQNEQRETSHWSLGVKGGGTYFRVSPNAEDYVDNASWGFGGMLEYTINPLWGFGLSVDYLKYDRDNLHGHGLHAILMTGRTIDAGLYSSVNVLNLLFPNRKAWRRGGIYANAGAGVGFYQAEVKHLHIKEDNQALFGTIGASVEVPLGNSFALFGEAQYRAYATETDAMGGMPSYHNNALVASLGLRVKFNANRKDHVRNTRPMTDQDAVNALRRDLQQVKNQTDKTATDANNLNNRINDDRRKQEEINKDVQNDIDELKQVLKK